MIEHVWISADGMTLAVRTDDQEAILAIYPEMESGANTEEVDVLDASWTQIWEAQS